VWVCASCGQENPEGFKFCGNCGAPLETPAAPREVRKVVTIVFCDLTGSTALGDRTDPEALRATMRGYYEEMRTILERHGGTVEKFVGDAVMAVFGVPVSHEDDATRAVRAAWEMREAVTSLGLQARIGVNTGEVVAGEGDTLVTGDAVNVAARLEQAAETGEVLIGDETRRLVRDAAHVEPVSVTAKGKPDAISAFRLVDFDLEASGVARNLGAPLIGRERELALLRQAYERVVSESSCQLFTLLGPAGVGKSRLVAEFLAGVDATVALGRCLDYGEGITLWPVIGALKQLGADETIQRITGSLPAAELFWNVRHRLEEAAAERPLVVVFEDIHWGQPAFLDLLDHISDLSRGAPIMLLCLARPELLDERPGWAGGKLNATTTLLEPLTAAESGRLLDALGSGLENDLRDRIVRASGGNPLFAEEMLALALEDGDVRAPSTVQALLQARLDRLPPAQRAVIERGAVEGEIFHRLSVTELSGMAVDGDLVGLVRKELIRPERSNFADDEAYRFRHLLIRDAAYDALPKETRAQLHTRFARWLERRGGLIELDEILGYHLEQAALYHRELGHPDDELEHAAARYLTSAGESAVNREDLRAAETLLRRALALLAQGDPERDEPLHILISARSWSTGDPDLIAELEQSADPVMRMNARLARAEHRIQFDPTFGIEDARRIAREADELFAQYGDDAGRAHAATVMAHSCWIASHARETLAHAASAREFARGAGISNFRSYALAMGPLTHGPLMPDEARALIGEIFGGAEGRFLRQSALGAESMLLRFEGRFDESRAHAAEADAIRADLGLTVLRHVMEQVTAECEYASGNFHEAARIYRQVYDKLGELGEHGFRSTVGIELGEALYELGERDEPERLALDAETMGGPDDLVNFAFGRALRARIAADRGELEAAETLAREALAYGERSDFPQIHARVREALGHVARAAGRTDEARAEFERAIAAHESHGDLVLAERTRQLLVEL
jgi:class 3 adenylate cyclase/tetratricopeptide (TPR) repeat protein